MAFENNDYKNNVNWRAQEVIFKMYMDNLKLFTKG